MHTLGICIRKHFWKKYSSNFPPRLFEYRKKESDVIICFSILRIIAGVQRNLLNTHLHPLSTGNGNEWHRTAGVRHVECLGRDNSVSTSGSQVKHLQLKE